MMPENYAEFIEYLCCRHNYYEAESLNKKLNYTQRKVCAARAHVFADVLHVLAELENGEQQ